jgi:hypothetical protein
MASVALAGRTTALTCRAKPSTSTAAPGKAHALSVGLTTAVGRGAGVAVPAPKGFWSSWHDNSKTLMTISRASGLTFT